MNRERCTNCNSERLEWAYQTVASVHAPSNGLLSLHDVTGIAVLHCEDCSETIRTLPAHEFIVLASPMWEIVGEMLRQDTVHPAGYPATRDGVRFGLATAQDELDEALDAWRADRCKCPVPLCGHATWSGTRGEMVQTAAVLMRTIRSIDAAVTE